MYNDKEGVVNTPPNSQLTNFTAYLSNVAWSTNQIFVISSIT